MITIHTFFVLFFTDTKMDLTIEDVTSSIDYQDVYSKISCKVGALNIMHYTRK